MKFLCLPGAFGSAKTFKIQLGPLAEELERRNLATFKYSQGSYEVSPPPGWEDYFGKGPSYRFLDTSRGDTFETLRKVRFIPRSLCPEDTMRMFQGASDGEDWHQGVWREALDHVFRTLDEDPEIDAVVGYSEGAMVAASMIVEEERKRELEGVKPRLKYAIFISGAPPLKFDGENRILTQLADEVGTVIHIPTFHIFGCDDAFLSSATALFNVCDPETATIFDHGLGHIVPRDAANVNLLGDILGEILPKIDGAKKKKSRGNVGGAGQGQGQGQKQEEEQEKAKGKKDAVDTARLDALREVLAG